MGAAAGCGHGLFHGALRWPHHADFQVFRAVEAPPAPAPRFYAGHYWRVWPAVFLRLADGAPAFGLTERSHAMQSEMQSFVRRHAADGLLDIECLDATPEQCLGQVSRLLGQARLLEARELGEHAWRLRVEVRLGALRYAGTSFLELPAGTGRIDGQARRSVGEQGYLFFGAYTFMKAGRYRLSVRGATATVTNSRA